MDEGCRRPTPYERLTRFLAIGRLPVCIMDLLVTYLDNGHSDGLMTVSLMLLESQIQTKILSQARSVCLALSPVLVTMNISMVTSDAVNIWTVL